MAQRTSVAAATRLRQRKDHESGRLARGTGPSTIEQVGPARQERQANEEAGWSPPAKGLTLVFAQVLFVGEADAFGTLKIGHVREDDYVALFEPVQDLDSVR
jgi:hypothetical protein